jgi:uncharacterized protein
MDLCNMKPPPPQADYSSNRDAAPTAPRQRIDAIDALRGLALLGVLVVNLETIFRVSIFEQFLPGPPLQGLDRGIHEFLDVFVELKALAVFSLLFGLGLAIQHERLAGHPRRAVLLVRRLVVLLGFGLIHLYLIWNGDILTEYALAGLLVLPFLWLPTWAVALAGLACLAFYLAMPFLPPIVTWPSQAWFAHQVEMANRIYSSGSWREILAFRIAEMSAFNMLDTYIFPRTVGLFLVGVLAWRLRIVQAAERYGRQMWWTSLLTISAGARLVLERHAPYEQLGTIVLALSYCLLVLGLANGPARRWLAWAEPVGRMAFTNYISQSVILGFVFYGYGLGQFDKLTLSEALAIAIALYAAQALFSRWWLQRFAYGPIEWLWRALMYGARPNFRMVRS